MPRGEPRHRTGERVRIPLIGLACIAGGRVGLERALEGLGGVTSAYVNSVTESAHLHIDPPRFDMDRAVEVIESFGARVAAT